MKVAVIGGGPVGLVTALYLESLGHSVDIFEKGTWPRDKTCGQGIMPSGIKKLSQLGIDFEPGKDCLPFNGINYIDGPLSLKGFLPKKGYGIERIVLSQKIINKIKEKKHINLFPNTTITETYNHFDKFKIIANDEEKIYDYAFACDGMNSPLRKKYNNRQVRKGVWRMGAREHFNQAPWSEKVEVYWSEKVEAYVTPVSDQKVEVAFLWFEDSIEQGSNLRENLWDNFPELKEKIYFEKSQKDFRGYGPFSTKSKEVKVGRLFFLGDAYCFLDGITGEGLSLGFKGAKVAAQNFSNWSWFSELKFKLHYWHYTFMVNLALSLSHHKRWRRLLFRMFNRIPKGFDFLLSLNDF